MNRVYSRNTNNCLVQPNSSVLLATTNGVDRYTVKPTNSILLAYMKSTTGITEFPIESPKPREPDKLIL